MPIIGQLIKGLVHASQYVTGDRDPVTEQRTVLKELLTQAVDTALGKKYGFQRILEATSPTTAFAEAVPFFDYHKINEEWWYRQHGLAQSNITWPGAPDYYALSSGTTGKKSKRIPVTDAMINAIKTAGVKQIMALKNFDLPADFFEKGILMLGSSTDLTQRKHHLEGEISGISASNIPSWFRGYYKPGEAIAEIDDWDERVAQIIKEAPDWDIGALSGIPSWMELMLKAVIDAHGLDTIHDIWPNLRVYTSGGVAFGPYEKSFHALMGKPVTVIDTYLASEGFIAFQNRPDTDAMQLITDNGIYFEFVPFDETAIEADGSLSPSARALRLDQVEKGVDYVLLISTVAGAWRYMIGDTITFTDVDRAEIQITGRTKFFLNTVGSQLSVNKLNDAVHGLETEYDIRIPEYTLCAKKFEDGFYHSWYLGSDSDIDTDTVATALDNFLKEANKNYKVARSKALKGVKVHMVPPHIFHEWSAASKKKGGQVKMERVMGEERFSEWETFVTDTIAQ